MGVASPPWSTKGLRRSIRREARDRRRLQRRAGAPPQRAGQRARTSPTCCGSKWQIDRFLARLIVAAPARWIGTGAYAIDPHLGARGRATRDVDRARRDNAAAALRDMRDASAMDGGEVSRFAVERSRQSLQRDDDRALALDLPAAPHEARRAPPASRQTRPPNMGHVGDQDGRAAYFATIATLGFDSVVMEFVATGQPPTLFRRRPAYLSRVLATLWTYRWPELTMRGDVGTFKEQILAAAVGNSSCYGDRIRITPDGTPDDGERIARTPATFRVAPKALRVLHSRPNVRSGCRA